MPTEVRRYSMHLMIVVLVLAALACSALQTTTEAATPTAPAQNVPAATAEAATQAGIEPTAASAESPTPAPMGSTVTTGSLEIKLLSVTKRDSIHLGEQFYYTPKAGNWLIDLVVRVRNLDSANEVTIPWKNIYIQEASGDAWYPMLGKVKTVPSGVDVDPQTIGLSGDTIDGESPISFTGDTYLRLIYGVAAIPKQDILFGIADSGPIVFQVK